MWWHWVKIHAYAFRRWGKSRDVPRPEKNQKRKQKAWSPSEGSPPVRPKGIYAVVVKSSSLVISMLSLMDRATGQPSA